MAKEIEALELNNTWTMCSLPTSHTLNDCKWVYKLKFHVDGSIERHKAQLVAKYFIQIRDLIIVKPFLLLPN